MSDDYLPEILDVLREIRDELRKRPLGTELRKGKSDKRWRTLGQAGEYIGAHRDTLRGYIADGSLPAYYIGKRRSIRVDLNDLDALLVRIPSAKSGRAR